MIVFSIAFAQDWTSRIDMARQADHIAILSGTAAFDGAMIRSRHIKHPDHQRARAYLLQQLQAVPGLLVEQEPFMAGTIEGVNLIATLPGSDPSLPALVVSAHYDSTGVLSHTYNPASSPAPGADDDASGCAAVLEIAHLLSEDQHQRTVQLILFDAEEAGLIGSQAHVDQRSTPTFGMVSIDSIGSNPADGWLFLSVGPEASTLQDAFVDRFVEQSTQALTELRPIEAALVGPPRSDHAAFIAAGLPAVHLGQFPLPTSYHTTDDTADALDPVFIADATAVVMAVVEQLAMPVAPPPPPVEPKGCSHHPLPAIAGWFGRR